MRERSSSYILQLEQLQAVIDAQLRLALISTTSLVRREVIIPDKKCRSEFDDMY